MWNPFRREARASPKLCPLCGLLPLEDFAELNLSPCRDVDGTKILVCDSCFLRLISPAFQDEVAIGKVALQIIAERKERSGEST